MKKHNKTSINIMLFISITIFFFLILIARFFGEWNNLKFSFTPAFATALVLFCISIIVCAVGLILFNTNERNVKQFWFVGVYVLLHQTLAGLTLPFIYADYGEGLLEMLLGGAVYLIAFVPTIVVASVFFVGLLHRKITHKCVYASSTTAFVLIGSLGVTLVFSGYELTTLSLNAEGAFSILALVAYTIMAIAFAKIIEINGEELLAYNKSNIPLEDKIRNLINEKSEADAKTKEKIDYYNSIM